MSFLQNFGSIGTGRVYYRHKGRCLTPWGFFMLIFPWLIVVIILVSFVGSVLKHGILGKILGVKQSTSASVNRGTIVSQTTVPVVSKTV